MKEAKQTAKHTPGPWKVGRITKGEVYYIPVSCADYRVAEVAAFGASPSGNEKQCRENHEGEEVMSKDSWWKTWLNEKTMEAFAQWKRLAFRGDSPQLYLYYRQGEGFKVLPLGEEAPEGWSLACNEQIPRNLSTDHFCRWVESIRGGLAILPLDPPEQPTPKPRRRRPALGNNVERGSREALQFEQ